MLTSIRGKKEKLARMLNRNYKVFHSGPSEAIKSSDWMRDRKPAGGFQYEQME